MASPTAEKPKFAKPASTGVKVKKPRVPRKKTSETASVKPTEDASSKTATST